MPHNAEMHVVLGFIAQAERVSGPCLVMIYREIVT